MALADNIVKALGVDPEALKTWALGMVAEWNEVLAIVRGAPEAARRLDARLAAIETALTIRVGGPPLLTFEEVQAKANGADAKSFEAPAGSEVG